ncbi:hypothetical protein ABZ345_24810 [Lentzea sp. NPDC005914]|uniref:hypothetical protein n=1 Tax=Lentzea sp. NPDC005914 TaxID=3154572 RepID=UPI0033F6F172
MTASVRAGRLDEARVTGMVTKLLGLKVAPKPVDALALAICHHSRAPMRDRVHEARAAELVRAQEAQTKAAEPARLHKAQAKAVELARLPQTRLAEAARRTAP